MAVAQRSANMTIMVRAAEKAGRALVRDFGELEKLQVTRKGVGDFVTQSDYKSEKIIYEELLKARPSYGFLMEEGGKRPGQDSDYEWIIDPIDGTTNFMPASVCGSILSASLNISSALAPFPASIFASCDEVISSESEKLITEVAIIGTL